jgi:hypothetical protein
VLEQHTVATAYELGWTELDNGRLLAMAEAAFDTLYQPLERLTLGHRRCGVIHFCPDRFDSGERDERGDRGSGRF